MIISYTSLRFLFACFGALYLIVGVQTQSFAQPKTDYGRMARPDLGSEYHEAEEEKKLWNEPHILSGPISRENGFFLNSNTIVEDEINPPPQNESSIAISPIDPDFLISSAVDSRAGAWVYQSYDGGQSWENKSLGVVNTNWQTGNDPSVGFDHLGNAYVMYGAFPRPFTGESGVYIGKSTDKGATWTAHIVVIEHTGEMTADSAFEDKYYIEIDRSSTSPYRGWMYTPWKRVTDADSATQIVFTRSTDGGMTWSTPIPISPRKPSTSTHITFGQSFPLVKCGPNGELYAVWNDGPARSIGFAKSTDGGDTWSNAEYPVSGYEYLGTDRFLTAEVTRIDTINKGTPEERYDTLQVTDTTDKYHVLKQTFRAETYPTIAVDYSSSTRRGWVYLCWSADTEPDIYFIRSSDGGETWSEPKSVHSDPRHDQWWPWISVDETNGDIAVMYSDSRDDDENILINTYVAYSSDGGDTWIDRRATDAVSDFRDNPFVDQVFAGDYSGNAFHDGKVYPSFLDTRDDNDVYTAVVDIRQPLPVENFKVGSLIEDLTEARLSWINPPLETAFGLPVEDYSLVLERDGEVIAELPSGTTTYAEQDLTLEQEYTYRIRVVVDADTSVARTVDFRSGGAKQSGRPLIGDVVQYRPTVEFSLTLPGVRADSVTPFTNLAKYRIYRDGELVREVDVDPTDTGSVIIAEDTPEERGYYRYSFSTLDAENPPNESPLSDTIVVYGGSTDEYSTSFDNGTPRFLNTGKWAVTDQFSLSPDFSLTDSPSGSYPSRTETWSQAWPFRAAVDGYISIRFNHVCIVRERDSALVEISYDSGTTWDIVQLFDLTGDEKWGDRSADPGDWKAENVITINENGSGGLNFIRFRLASDPLGTADGWFIDDLEISSFPLSVKDEKTETFFSEVYPNPFADHAILRFTLPEPGEVKTVLYDRMGREVGRIERGVMNKGHQSLTIDGSDFSSGMYFYVLETPFGVSRGSFMLMK